MEKLKIGTVVLNNETKLESRIADFVKRNGSDEVFVVLNDDKTYSAEDFIKCYSLVATISKETLPESYEVLSCIQDRVYEVKESIKGSVVTVSIYSDGILIAERVHDLSAELVDAGEDYNPEEDIDFVVLVNEGKNHHYVHYSISWGMDSDELSWEGFSVVMEFDNNCKMLACETSSTCDAEQIPEWSYWGVTDSLRRRIFVMGREIVRKEGSNFSL